MRTQNHKWFAQASLGAVIAILVGGAFWGITWHLSQQPPEGAISHQGLVSLEQWVSEEGTRIYFSKREELPIVDVVLRWDAGSIREKEAYGLANLTRSVFTEGPEALSANQLAEKLENIGVELSENTEHDYSELSFRVINDSDKINQTVAILAELLRAPAFREEDLQRVRKNLLTELEYQAHNPTDIAKTTFMKAVFGPTHPYGRNVLGDATHLEQITSAELKDFYKNHYSTRNLTVAVVGALQSREVATLVKELTKGLPTHELSPIKVAKPSTSAFEQNIVFPSVQTKIILGSATIARDDPDRYALLVGNQILGDNALYNRLAKEIRVDRGLAYSPKSSFNLESQSGTFMITLGTRNDQAKEAQRVARQVLTNFIQEGPTQEELDRIKKTILGRLPLGIASNADVLNIVADLGFHELPLDVLERFHKEVEGLTIQQIQAAFARHLDPAKLVLVTVGGSA